MAEKPEEQAVADQPEGGTQQSPAEGGGAQGEETLESLLAQFDSESGAGGTPADTSGQSAPGTGAQDQSGDDKGGSGAAPDDINELVSWAREERNNRIVEQTNRDVNAAVEALKEGWDEAPPDRFLRGELHRAAADDPRFLRAFQQRHSNPDGWKRVLRAQQRELKDELAGRPDPAATDDRRAVEAAVRSSSTAPPPAAGPSDADWNNMSDAEFNKRYREMMYPQQ